MSVSDQAKLPTPGLNTRTIRGYSTPRSLRVDMNALRGRLTAVSQLSDALQNIHYNTSQEQLRMPSPPFRRRLWTPLLL